MFTGNRDRSDYRISKDGPEGELCKSAAVLLHAQLICLYTATWGQKSGHGALLCQADWDTATSRNWKQKLDKFKKVFWLLVCKVDFDENNLVTLILLSLTAHLKMKIWCYSKMQVCCSYILSNDKKHQIHEDLMTCIMQEVKPDEPGSPLSFIIY